MKQMHIPRRLMLSGSVAAAAFVVAGLSASAQTATTTAIPTTSSAAAAGNLATKAAAPKGTSTSQMVQEACQRQRARTAKFLQSGIPEQWGSEEPFTFNPNTPCP